MDQKFSESDLAALWNFVEQRNAILSHHLRPDKISAKTDTHTLFDFASMRCSERQ